MNRTDAQEDSGDIVCRMDWVKAEETILCAVSSPEEK